MVCTQLHVHVYSKQVHSIYVHNYMYIPGRYMVCRRLNYIHLEISIASLPSSQSWPCAVHSCTSLSLQELCSVSLQEHFVDQTFSSEKSSYHPLLKEHGN